MKQNVVHVPRRGALLLVVAGLTLPLLQRSAVGGPPLMAPGTAEPAVRGARITGVVRFRDEYPSRDTIALTQNQDVCGTSTVSQTFLVSPDAKALQNVLVTVEGVSGGKAPSPTSTATIIQDGCIYRPHLQVVELGDAGTDLLVRNEDGIMHNIHARMGRRTLFNSAQPPALKELKKKLRRPGVAVVQCDIHSWMKAYIVVLQDQPYYSVTDEAGRFAIDGVPAGSYTLRFWHEGLGEMTKTVTVTDGETTDVDFVVPLKG